MSANEMSLEDFLGHKGTTGGGGGYAENWKKRKPPIFDSFIHTRSMIASLWQHAQPTVVEFTDKNTKEKKQVIFGRNFVCWEDEAILQEQWKRDRDTGRRVKPPTICPDCLLNEWVYEQIAAGELDWCKVVFRYEAKDSDEPVIVHAGGMIGAYGRRKPPLSESEMKQLRDAKIRLNDAWKENQLSKLYYVISVADADHPENGVLPYTIANGLGDAIKEVIHKEIMSAEDEGNPFKHPYCIRWMHHPDDPNPSKKYDAAKMGKIKVTDAIRKLIVDDDPPSMARLIARGNPYLLRAQMEDACVLKGVPWDRIFGRACKAWDAKEGKEGSKGDGSDFDTEELERPAKREAAKPKQEDDDRPCEECGEIVPAGAKKCPGCKVPVALIGDDIPSEDNSDLPYG